MPKQNFTLQSALKGFVRIWCNSCLTFFFFFPYETTTLPHGLAVTTGLHDNCVGDREKEEEEDLGERGDSDVRDHGESAGHTGQQGVGHVGTSPLH